MARDSVTNDTGELSRIMCLNWKIQNFLSLSDRVNYSVYSPWFHFEGAKWRLQLFPNGESNNKSSGCINMYLRRERFNTSLTQRAWFHFRIKKRDGSEYKSWSCEHTFEGNSAYWGVLNWCELSDVFFKANELAPNGTITFSCYLQVKSGGSSEAANLIQSPVDNGECKKTRQESVKYDKISGSSACNKTQQESQICDKTTGNSACNETKQESQICDKTTGAHKLAKNLKDLLLSKEECDITLKVKNQVFPAHKAILVARSSVFSSMFRHEMAEKISGEVNIPDCDPDAFQLFLIYLYEGTVEGLSSDNVFNVYEIANKYDAVELKMNCTEYMKNSLSVESVCDVVAHSLLHSESDLLAIATDFFIKNFNGIIISVKWRSFLEENLTAANELLIKASKYHCPPK